MEILGHISVKQRLLPDQQVDSGPWIVQLCGNDSGLNSHSGWHLTPSHVWFITIFMIFVMKYSGRSPETLDNSTYKIWESSELGEKSAKNLQYNQMWILLWYNPPVLRLFDSQKKNPHLFQIYSTMSYHRQNTSGV